MSFLALFLYNYFIPPLHKMLRFKTFLGMWQEFHQPEGRKYNSGLKSIEKNVIATLQCYWLRLSKISFF